MSRHNFGHYKSWPGSERRSLLPGPTVCPPDPGESEMSYPGALGFRRAWRPQAHLHTSPALLRLHFLTCTPHLHGLTCMASPAHLTCTASPAESSSRLSFTTPGGAFPWVPWGGLWINNESDSGFCVKIRFHSILILVLFRDTNTSGLSPLQASL